MLLDVLVLSLVAATVLPIWAYPSVPGTVTTTNSPCEFLGMICSTIEGPTNSTSLPVSTLSTLALTSLTSEPAPTPRSTLSTSTTISTSTPTSMSMSSPTPTPTLTSMPTSIHSGSLTLTLLSTLPSQPSTSSSPSRSIKTDASVIAGGVIGSVVGGALIGTLLFWLLTRRKPSQTSLQMSERKMVSSSPPSTKSAPAGQAPPHSGEHHIRFSLPLSTTQPVSQFAPQNPYDPDDIPTSSTTWRLQPSQTMSKLFSTTETYWGQVGQYYHGVPEV